MVKIEKLKKTSRLTTTTSSADIADRHTYVVSLNDLNVGLGIFLNDNDIAETAIIKTVEGKYEWVDELEDILMYLQTKKYLKLAFNKLFM